MSRKESSIVVPLPLREKRAVGGPVAMQLLATLFGLALAGWLAAAAALVAAAPDLARAHPGGAAPVLAAHFIGLALLPPAVAGASFHLLPVMLRNDLRGGRRLWLLPPLLAAGLALAPGIALDAPVVVWPAAAALTCGLGLMIAELGGLLVHAPAGRRLVTSRTGVALSLLHAAAALALGALVFGRGEAPLAGVAHDRWVLVHLHVAVLGWLTLFIVAVARTLAPMLAMAPAVPPRRFPVEEVALVLGLWSLAAGLAADARPLEVAGSSLVVIALAAFFAALIRSARKRRGPLEAPLVHMLAGLLFLGQAAVLGLGLASGVFEPGRALVAYVVFLLLGWAAGVVLGHVGKLLSLSLWVWWPPGPRPRQELLYPRRLWLVEAAAFALGVETVGLGALLGSVAAVRVGAAALCLAALAGVLGSAVTWSRRPRPGRP